jgi:hypothetical protein
MRFCRLSARQRRIGVSVSQEQTSLWLRWGGRLAEGDGELGLAGFVHVIKGAAGAFTFRSFEEESVLEAVREGGETSFAIDIGADFEIEFTGTGESIGNMDFYFGSVDGPVISVGNGEIGSALSNAGVNCGNGVGVGCLRQTRGGQKQREE